MHGEEGRRLAWYTAGSRTTRRSGAAPPRPPSRCAPDDPTPCAAAGRQPPPTRPGTYRALNQNCGNPHHFSRDLQVLNQPPKPAGHTTLTPSHNTPAEPAPPRKQLPPQPGPSQPTHQPPARKQGSSADHRPATIILDANILKGISLRGPVAELLRTIRASGVESVTAPWIAVEELAAQQALRYEEKYQAALSAVEDLAKATSWGSVLRSVRADPERVREHWRERYSEVAATLETSVQAYQEAMFREANLLAPCKSVNSGKDKTGARGATIWLTAVNFARQSPDETVYFVSNNTRDFVTALPSRTP
ncbi:PIN domain-containing protein [Kitasatospora sp. NPDC058190]|uniref:PIN domain-containing protein n=1 Tax=Kitasatospora sp. NPDC058190 TaxID=3346371 RepID=UPI0036DD8C4D